MLKAIQTTIILLGLGFSCAAVCAQEGPASELELSKEVRGLLQNEMRQISAASRDLATCLVSGDWESIERISAEIRESYIMARSLTASQRQELKDKLPERFKWLDKDFHSRAEKLRLAAAARDPETVAFQYSRLLEACATCHAAYAKNRFPGFLSKTPEEHHH